MNIGFIGLGNLGTPIALNLLESGHSLTVYNRTAAKTVPLQEKGASHAENIAALASASNIVFTIVSDDAALKDVSAQLVQHLQPGSIHVSLSTILPQTASELEALHQQHSLLYLASPVFGRPEAAKAKKLNFVISGDANTRQQITPLLKDAGGAGVWDFGDAITAANTVKLCGNFMIAAALESIGESIDLARKSGVDTQVMWNMFTQTIFNSPIYINYGNIILHQQFEPAAFTARLGLKDLNLVLQQASAANHSMPVANLVQQHLQTLVNNGNSEIDWCAVSKGGE
ncbi:MAG: NAD(P)-dependent oxidoreductase [Chitinophagaceae bacterium]